MAVLIIVIQIVSLVFYFKLLDEGGDYEGRNNGKYTFEGCLWYIIVKKLGFDVTDTVRKN